MADCDCPKIYLECGNSPCPRNYWQNVHRAREAQWALIENESSTRDS